MRHKQEIVLGSWQEPDNLNSYFSWAASGVWFGMLALESVARPTDSGEFSPVLVERVPSVVDVLVALRSAVRCPLAAFSVSGEYQMLKRGALSGLADEMVLFSEFLGSLRRAGADLIVTYAAKSLAVWMGADKAVSSN